MAATWPGAGGGRRGLHGRDRVADGCPALAEAGQHSRPAGAGDAQGRGGRDAERASLGRLVGNRLRDSRIVQAGGERRRVERRDPGQGDEVGPAERALVLALLRREQQVVVAPVGTRVLATRAAGSDRGVDGLRAQEREVVVDDPGRCRGARRPAPWSRRRPSPPGGSTGTGSPPRSRWSRGRRTFRATVRSRRSGAASASATATGRHGRRRRPRRGFRPGAAPRRRPQRDTRARRGAGAGAAARRLATRPDPVAAAGAASGRDRPGLAGGAASGRTRPGPRRRRRVRPGFGPGVSFGRKQVGHGEGPSSARGGSVPERVARGGAGGGAARSAPDHTARHARCRAAPQDRNNRPPDRPNSGPAACTVGGAAERAARPPAWRTCQP